MEINFNFKGGEDLKYFFRCMNYWFYYDFKLRHYISYVSVSVVGGELTKR